MCRWIIRTPFCQMGFQDCFIHSFRFFANPLYSATTTNLGSDFWLTFTYNPMASSTPSSQFELNIVSWAGATGTVSIGSTSFTASFTIPAQGMTVINLPLTSEVTSIDGVTAQNGIHVTSSADIDVIGFAYVPGYSDAYLGLPTDTLGYNYMVSTYPSELIGSTVYGGEFAVVATQDNTTLSVVPSITTGTHAAGVPYNVSLNQGDVYQYIDQTAGDDLSGTQVNSTLPVAVIQGTEMSQIPVNASGGNYTVEEAWPIADWGSTFFNQNFLVQTGAEEIKIVACANNTQLFINSLNTYSPLSSGQSTTEILSSSNIISTSSPIQMTQYSNSSSGNWDSFSLTLPPVSSYGTSYIFGSPLTGFTGNYINLAVPSSGINSIVLDGTLIPSGAFSPIGTSGYYSGQFGEAPGINTVSGAQPFEATYYGYAAQDGYGSPAGAQLILHPPSFTFTATPTVTVTPTPTSTLSATPSYSPTISYTPTLSFTPTDSPTPTATFTPSLSPTPTYSTTATFTPSASFTATPTFMPTSSFTPSATLSPVSAISYPDTFWVDHNQFNPTNDPVSIEVIYSAYPGPYSLRIFNTAGELIRDLGAEAGDPGYLSGPLNKWYAWDGRNMAGATCASGIYIIYLKEPFDRKIKKVLLIH